MVSTTHECIGMVSWKQHTPLNLCTARVTVLVQFTCLAISNYLQVTTELQNKKNNAH